MTLKRSRSKSFSSAISISFRSLAGRLEVEEIERLVPSGVTSGREVPRPSVAVFFPTLRPGFGDGVSGVTSAGFAFLPARFLVSPRFRLVLLIRLLLDRPLPPEGLPSRLDRLRVGILVVLEEFLHER